MFAGAALLAGVTLRAEVAMTSLISRDYCLAHPIEISRLYGVDVLLGTVFHPKRTLLQQVASSFHDKRWPMPGYVGEAYRLSRLLELRAAHIYRAMAKRFAHVIPAHELFVELQQEEEEHARVMEVCLYTVTLRPGVSYTPSIRDPDIRGMLKQMRAIERRVPSMTLDEALQTAVDLELGEVNTVFGTLLKQLDQPEVTFLREMLRHAETHQDSVPRRVKALREQLGQPGAPGASPKR